MGRWNVPSQVRRLQCKLHWLHFFSTEEESIVSTRDRLRFKPTAEEIVEFTVPHLSGAPTRS
jgi:hypothetical protein